MREFSPRRISLRAQAEVRELGGVARDLPYQLRDVMEQTRQGRLVVQIRNPGFDDLAYHIDHAVNRLAVALIVLGGLAFLLIIVLLWVVAVYNGLVAGRNRVIPFIGMEKRHMMEDFIILPFSSS